MNELETAIANKVRNRWRLRRLFLFYAPRLPYWGQSLVIAQILVIGLQYSAGFTRSQLRRLLKGDVSEIVPAPARRWLMSLTSDGGDNVGKK